MKIVRKNRKTRSSSFSRTRSTTRDTEVRKNEKTRVFRAQDYPLVVRFINGYVVVTAPDFQFPVPALKCMDLESPNLRAIGEMVYMTHLQVVAELKDRERVGISHPTPSTPHDVVPRPPRTLSLSEASKRLGLKPHVVRALADSGEIRATRTPGHHRRFLFESVENYLKQNSLPVESLAPLNKGHRGDQ